MPISSTLWNSSCAHTLRPEFPNITPKDISADRVTLSLSKLGVYCISISSHFMCHKNHHYHKWNPPQSRRFLQHLSPPPRQAKVYPGDIFSRRHAEIRCHPSEKSLWNGHEDFFGSLPTLLLPINYGSDQHSTRVVLRGVHAKKLVSVVAIIVSGFYDPKGSPLLARPAFGQGNKNQKLWHTRAELDDDDDGREQVPPGGQSIRPRRVWISCSYRFRLTWSWVQIARFISNILGVLAPKPNIFRGSSLRVQLSHPETDINYRMLRLWRL